MKYPRPRYKSIVIMDPAAFNWLPIDGTPGAERKFLGAFSERAFSAEMIKLRPGTTWSSLDDTARRLLVVLSGEGHVHGQAIDELTALQVEPNETLDLTSQSELELYLVGLPPIQLPAIPSTQFDFTELGVESVVT
jgi:hypothetical protein